MTVKMCKMLGYVSRIPRRPSHSTFTCTWAKPRDECRLIVAGSYSQFIPILQSRTDRLDRFFRRALHVDLAYMAALVDLNSAGHVPVPAKGWNV